MSQEQGSNKETTRQKMDHCNQHDDKERLVNNYYYNTRYIKFSYNQPSCVTIKQNHRVGPTVEETRR